MIRRLAMTTAAGLIVAGFGLPGASVASGRTATAAATAEATTHTGWFSDVACAAPRVKSGNISPNNPDCVKRCLDEGKAAVFVSEQAKALYEVKGYESVKDDVGWHIELTGTIDADAKTIEVQSVKRLEYVGAMCGVRKKTTAAKPTGGAE